MERWDLETVPISDRTQRNPSSRSFPSGPQLLMWDMTEWVLAGTGFGAYPFAEQSHYHCHILAQILILLAISIALKTSAKRNATTVRKII